MKTVILTLSFILIGTFFNQSIAQSNIPDANAPLMFDMYQIYMDVEFHSILKIEYEKEAKALKGRLSVKRDIIILDNYDGKSRVKITYKDKQGNEATFQKSRCFIDPYVPL